MPLAYTSANSKKYNQSNQFRRTNIHLCEWCYNFKSAYFSIQNYYKHKKTLNTKEVYPAQQKELTIKKT